jgi:multidrug efflux system outer membrane protein
VLTALREVSDALIARQRLADVSEQQVLQVQALVQSVKLSLERYDAGKASYYEVLEAQQELFPAQLDLTRTQTSQLLAVVDLYKALGGGWDNLTNPIPPPQAN